MAISKHRATQLVPRMSRGSPEYVGLGFKEVGHEHRSQSLLEKYNTQHPTYTPDVDTNSLTAACTHAATKSFLDTLVVGKASLRLLRLAPLLAHTRHRVVGVADEKGYLAEYAHPYANKNNYAFTTKMPCNVYQVARRRVCIR